MSLNEINDGRGLRDVSATLATNAIRCMNEALWLSLRGHDDSEYKAAANHWAKSVQKRCGGGRAITAVRAVQMALHA